MKIIRIKSAAVKCDVVPLTIRRWSTDPKYAHLNFPRLLDLGDNSRGLIEEEVDSWLEARAAAREVA